MSPYNQYDTIGFQYTAVKELPAVRYAEIPAVRALLGDLTGLDVLDLGCGTGHYTRICRELGASTISGVDSSTEMIAQARHHEEQQPIGASYHVGNVEELPILGEHDVVLAVYLFNYAPDRSTLRAMLHAISTNCREGARLVALVADGESPIARPELRRYGVGFDKGPESEDAVGLTVTAYCQPVVSFRSHALKRTVIDDCLQAEGFREVYWNKCTISPDGVERFGLSYWRDFEVAPPWATLTAVARHR